MNIVIANRQRKKRVDVRLLKQVAGELLAELEISEAELGINLVAAREMALVNETFLKHTGSTDVITFDHLERRNRRAGGPQALHGELFICVDDAVAQAKEFETNWQAEVVRYVVHGVLHLVGYDDLKPRLRRVMKREENRLVRRLASRFSLAQLARPVKISL